MLLSIDIGNTNITMGLYKNDILLDTFRISSDKGLSVEGYEILFRNIFVDCIVKDCIIGSVVGELSQKIKQVCDKIFNLDSCILDNVPDFNMPIKLENPQELGADRIANAYGAKKKYKLPLIVVDIGTATTFDIVSKNGEFLGGVIMPGLNLQFKSLNTNTSKLPNLNVGKSEKAIGNSTEKAMLSGIMRGSASAIEGLINQCESELGEKATIVATGGHSKLISEYMIRQFDYIDSSLTLDGLKELYEYRRLVKKIR